MRFRNLCTLMLLLAAAIATAAEQGRLSGPVSAFVLDDATGSLRPVLGVPGAAYLGNEILAGVDAALTSPNGRLIAALRHGTLSLLRREGDVWTASVLAEGLPASARILWSADSQTLAAVEDTAQIWDLSGKLVSTWPVPGSLAAAVVAGTNVVFAVKGGVFLASSEGTRLLAQADDPSALAIAGEDLYFSDRSRGEVWLLRGYLAAAQPALAAKVEDPVALAVDINRRLLLVAGAATRKLGAFRLGGFEPAFELALEFEPSSLDTFGQSGWLLNAGRRGPLQVLAIEDAPAVYFIPREERN